jgi:hypothetical protein
MEHTFYMYQTKEDVVSVLKGFMNDKKNPIVTMITETSQFLYPVELLKTRCIIIVEDCFIQADNEDDKKAVKGKIVNLSDIRKK